MTISYIIEAEVPTGLKTKSVILLLRDNGNYRRYEHAGLAVEVDVEGLLTAPVLNWIWSQATTITQQQWRDAQLRQVAWYYVNIVRAIETVRLADGSLNEALVAGLAAINDEDAPDVFGSSAFADYQEWMDFGSPPSIEERRTALLLIQNFALIGLMRVMLFGKDTGDGH